MTAEIRRAHVRVPPIAWMVAAAAWALVIFCLSTGAFGLSFTEPLVAGGLRCLHLTVSDASFWALHIFVRKLAHLAEYAILAGLLCVSSEEVPLRWSPRRVLGCFLIVVAYSLTDEYHQSFVPGRNASLRDCGIDSIGGAMGILPYYVNYLRLRTICRTTSEVS
jgi:VanZ family protein